MIWSDPRSRENVAEELASTIDISATILDRVGLVPYRGMQGQAFFLSLKVAVCTVMRS